MNSLSVPEASKVEHCIFCMNPTANEPVEHIAPEGLIGHQQFQVSSQLDREVYLVLDKDQVCGRCNRGPLKDLDEYLQKQFGLLKVLWNSEGTKSGKPAKAERPGLFAVRRPDGPYVGINAETKKVMTDDGVIIQPTRSHPQAVRLEKLEARDNIAKVRFSQPMRMNKRFIRGLHKIAFELLCFQEGLEYVLNSRFDPIREYVLYGKGSRDIVFSIDPVGTWEKPFFRMHAVPGTQDWVAELNLGAAFFIDLSPGNDLYKRANVDELKASNLLRWSDKEGGSSSKG